MIDQFKPAGLIPDTETEGDEIERMDDEGPPPGELPGDANRKKLVQDGDDQDKLDEALRYRQEQDALARTGSNEMGVNQPRGQNPRGEAKRR